MTRRQKRPLKRRWETLRLSPGAEQLSRVQELAGKLRARVGLGIATESLRKQIDEAERVGDTARIQLLQDQLDAADLRKAERRQASATGGGLVPTELSPEAQALEDQRLADQGLAPVKDLEAQSEADLAELADQRNQLIRDGVSALDPQVRNIDAKNRSGGHREHPDRTICTD